MGIKDSPSLAVKPVPVVKHVRYRIRRYQRHKRCEAEVAEFTQKWRVHAGKDKQCEMGGMYSVNGQYFCKRHAGHALIDLLIDGEEWIE